MSKFSVLAIPFALAITAGAFAASTSAAEASPGGYHRHGGHGFHGGFIGHRPHWGHGPGWRWRHGYGYGYGFAPLIVAGPRYAADCYLTRRPSGRLVRVCY